MKSLPKPEKLSPISKGFYEESLLNLALAFAARSVIRRSHTASLYLQLELLEHQSRDIWEVECFVVTLCLGI